MGKELINPLISTNENQVKYSKGTAATIVAAIKINMVEEIIATIEGELGNSNSTDYTCEDQSVIPTDVGYVYDWFSDYKRKITC